MARAASRHRLAGAALAAALAVALAPTAGCDRGGGEGAERAPEPAPRGPVSVPVLLAGERFHLELAADPERRTRGLGGREHLPANSGMLFVFPEDAPRQFVMRDCLIPLDVAFLDAEGVVVAVHTMPVEPPRRGDESFFAYEARLTHHASGAPARFAIEVAGGRLVALGLRAGDRVELDRAALLRDAH